MSNYKSHDDARSARFARAIFAGELERLGWRKRMSAITDLFQQAQLAEVAYSDCSDPKLTTQEALTTRDGKLTAA